MTLTRIGKRQISRERIITRRRVFCFMSLFIIILFFKNASAASLWVSNGLYLCATRLIPSLFPFMVLSVIAIESGACASLGKLPAKPFRRIFKLGEAATGAVIIGWLCGFPVGARSLCELYSEGKISDSEYRRAVCMSGTPSPAFLISAVGAESLGSPSLGVVLYVLSLACSAIIGAVMALGDKESKNFSESACNIEAHRGIAAVFTHAVTSSAVGMATVCAFVVFFSAFLGVVESVISRWISSEVATALIYSFFELTSGVSRAAEVSPNGGIALCAAAIGWSGLSVHFQTVSMCASAPFPLKPYIACHAAKAVLMSLLTLVISLFLQ